MMEKGIVIISKYGISLKAEWSRTVNGYRPAPRKAAGKVCRDMDELKDFFAGYLHAELQKVADTAKEKAMAFKMAFSKTEYLVALDRYGKCVKDGSTDTFLWKYVIDHFECCFTPEVLDSYRKEMRLSIKRLSSKPNKKGKDVEASGAEKKKPLPSNGTYVGTVLPMPGQAQVSTDGLSRSFRAFRQKHGTALPLEWHEIDTVTHLVARIGRMTLPIPIGDIVSAHEIKRDVPTFSISCSDGFTYHLKLFSEWKIKTFNRHSIKKYKKD